VDKGNRESLNYEEMEETELDRHLRILSALIVIQMLNVIGFGKCNHTARVLKCAQNLSADKLPFRDLKLADKSALLVATHGMPHLGLIIMRVIGYDSIQ